jgi:glycosyltransferase involved in cell wall biosynthesis
MRKIRVLEFSNQWSMGGTEKASQIFMTHMDKDAFSVFAAGWRGGDRLELIKSVSEEVFISENQKEMIDWIKSKNIDIVHFHRQGDPEHILVETFKSAGVPILVEQNIFAHADTSPDEAQINRHIFLSKIQKEMYKQRAGSIYNEDKCRAIYYPVETDYISNYKFNRDMTRPTFGRYSRKDARKWHPINIQILPYIKAEIPDAKFVVIGLPDDYRNTIWQMGCLDMVEEHPGTVNEEELCRFLEKINIFTHGSVIGESFGMAIAESMAAGLPVVTHFGGDAAQAELVTDGYNGFVTDQSDVYAYADRVIQLLKNTDLRLEMGKKGKERCISWFNAKKVTKELEELFIEEFEKLS